MTALRAEVVGDGDRLAVLEAEWWALWRRCPAATPFQSPAWLLPWWRSFAPGPLRTVAVWRGERLVGLATFYGEETSGRLLPVGISLSDYGDLLLDPEVEEEAARSLVEAVSSLSWRAWSLEELPPEAAAWALPRPADASETVAEQSACPVLALDGGDALGGSVPARKRQHLRTSRNRAARLGTVAISDTAGCPAEFLDHLFQLHALRWQARGEGGVLADERVRRFHAEALPRLAAAGLARCYLLSLGGEVVGAHYGLAHGRRSFFYLGGFDPRFAEASPGTILVGHAMEDAVAAGAREFHFLRGREPYKYAWGAADRLNRRRLWERAP